MFSGEFSWNTITTYMYHRHLDSLANTYLYCRMGKFLLYSWLDSYRENIIPEIIIAALGALRVHQPCGQRPRKFFQKLFHKYIAIVQSRIFSTTKISRPTVCTRVYKNGQLE